MSNKLFFTLLALFLAPCLGWMAYDYRASLEGALREAGNGDLLMGQDGALAQVQYLFRFPSPVFHHDLDTSGLEALGRAGEGGEHSHIYGLTLADYSLGTHYEVNWSKRWFEDRYDLWVEDLRVEFTYNHLDVYVTSEYAPGSCEYQATMDHEAEHTRVHQRVYGEFQRRFREAVGASKAIPLSSDPILVSSIEEGKQRVGVLISGVLDPLFQRFKQTLAREQGALDTPESYAGLKQRCGHWSN